MKTARIVIGSAFGDCGKGLMTDFHAADADLVVRFNGGAQAGHTVQTSTGQRHIFSHFGAGSFRYVPTYLSRHFICNPKLFREEYNQLSSLTPKVYVHPEAMITLPYDMMLNQWSEQDRGDKRHGSVGVGINETVTRDAIGVGIRDGMFRTSWTYPQMKDELSRVRDDWVPRRMKQLQIEATAERLELLNSESLLYRFIDDCAFYIDNTRSSADIGAIKHVVMEGAQGLMLDQDYGTFPHVTRSHTGLRNAMAMAKELDIDHVDATYVTRSYLTRHGAGPLPDECDMRVGLDRTNVPNEFQGTMRFALLDVDLVASFIRRDIEAYGSGLRNASLAMTWCDQSHLQPGYAYEKLIKAAKLQRGWASFGPTRDHVQRVR